MRLILLIATFFAGLARIAFVLIARRDKPAEDAGNEIADGERPSPTIGFPVHGKAE